MTVQEELIWVLQGLIRVVEHYVPEPRCAYDKARLDQAHIAIERAENAHEGLVKALEDFLVVVKGMQGLVDIRMAVVQAQAALATARGARSKDESAEGRDRWTKVRPEND